MDIANVIDITISVASPSVTKLGFGTPCIYAYNTIIPASTPVVEYATSTWSADLIAAGFNVDDPVYLAAQAIAAQNPKPPTFKVMRGTQTFSHDVDLTMLTATVGETITLTITGEDPAVPNTLISETYTRICAGGGIPAEATAMAALITAGLWGVAGDITATWPGGVSEVVEIRAQGPYANQMLYYSGVTNLSIADVTALRTVAAELTANVAYDPDWYMLVCPDCGTLDSLAVATWISGQTNKTCALQTQDTEVVSAGTGIGDTLSGDNRTRTGLLYSQHGLNQNPACAWAARFLPEKPGTEVWGFKALTGVTPSNLTTAQSGFAHGDYVNTVEGITSGGIEVVTNQVYKGWSSGSSETFMDTIRLVDALVAEVQTRLLSLFMASRKVPYNDSGIGQVKAAILASIRAFEGPSAGFLPGSAFCEVPLRSDVAAADIAARELNNVVFGATLNGAIMKVTISATLEY